MDAPLREKVNKASVEMDKLIKLTEKLINQALNSSQARSSIFDASLSGATDSIQDLTAQNMTLTNMLNFNRKPDRSTVTMAQAVTQYEVCKAAHNNALEASKVLKSLLKT